MKRVILILLIATGILSAQEFTLEKSLEIGLSNSKSLNIHKAKIISAKAKVSEISSQFYPQISAGFIYNRLSDIPPFEFTAPFSPVPIKIQDPILNNYILRAGFQLPVFMGFKLSSLKSAAKLNSDAVRNDFTAETNNEAMKITEAYFNYLQAQEAVKLLEKSFKNMKEHYRDAKNSYEAGLIKKNELLKIELETKKIESSLIEAENRKNIARTFFNKAIGINLTETTEVAWNADDNSASSYNLNELLNEALKNRKEIISFSLRKKASGKNIESAKSGYFPNLSLFGNYYYNRPNQRILPLEDKFADTWEVGIAVNWNVFDWGKTSAQVTQAEQAYTQISNQFDLLKENIKTEVIKNYMDFQSAQAKVETQKLAVISAEENLKVTNDLFNQQMASASELTDAETQLFKAETELLFARIEVRLSQIKLFKSIGRKIY